MPDVPPVLNTQRRGRSSALSLTTGAIAVVCCAARGDATADCQRGQGKTRKRHHGVTYLRNAKHIDPSTSPSDAQLLADRHTIAFRSKARFEDSAPAAWPECAAEAGGVAVGAGRPVPATYGNQAGCAGQTPLATALCPHVDVVWIESSRHFQPCLESVKAGSETPTYRTGVFVEASRRPRQPAQAWSTLLYKVGRAASHFQRPVWTMHYPGQWHTRALRAQVEDGHLDLRFEGPNVGPLFHNTIEWLVAGVVIQRPGQALLPAAQRSLLQSELLETAALREWAIQGPFDDTDCTGMDQAFGPERLIDAAAQYAGKDGLLRWQRWTQEAGGRPGVPLHDLVGDCDETVAFALTHVHSARAREAVLLASTSQTGCGYLNGKLAFRDEVGAGLLPNEVRAPLKLQAGWNSLLLKSTCRWSRHWSLWAALTDAQGRPLRDLEVSAWPER